MAELWKSNPAEALIKEQEKKAYFTGNVKVVQGTTTMRAGKMTVLYTGEGASMTSGSTLPTSQSPTCVTTMGESGLSNESSGHCV